MERRGLVQAVFIQNFLLNKNCYKSCKKNNSVISKNMLYFFYNKVFMVFWLCCGCVTKAATNEAARVRRSVVTVPVPQASVRTVVPIPTASENYSTFKTPVAVIRTFVYINLSNILNKGAFGKRGNGLNIPAF